MSGFALLLEVLGAVALLLWAVRMVKTGIQRAWGNQLRELLNGANNSRIGAAAAGLCLAMMLQSATAASLLSLSLASMGALSTLSALAAFLGAEIGSTLVVQVFSHDLSTLTPVLLLVGVVLFLSSDERQRRQLGRVIVGLGLLLLSLDMIVATATELRQSAALPLMFEALAKEPMLAFVIAVVITWLFHSTVAALLLTIALASSGVIDVALGFVLVLGANAGGGFIVLALSRHEKEDVAVVPRANLIIRLLGALMFLPWVGSIQPWLLSLGASDPAAQLAWFYTLVGVTISLCCLPFLPAILRLSERLSPAGQKMIEQSAVDPRAVLSRASSSDADTSLNHATREVLHLAERVEAMLGCVPEMFEAEQVRLVPDLQSLEDEVDVRSHALKEYLVSIDPEKLDENGNRRCLAVLAFCVTLEQAADMVEQSLRAQAIKKIKRNLVLSNEGWSELQAMHKQLMSNMHLALHVIMTEDLNSAQQLLLAHGRFHLLESKYFAKHLMRLRSGTEATRASSSLHLDVMRVLAQINALMTSVAQPMVQGGRPNTVVSAVAGK